MVICCKTVNGMVNSTDPDQTVPEEQSNDLSVSISNTLQKSKDNYGI